MIRESFKKPLESNQIHVEFPKDPVLEKFSNKYGVPYEDLSLTPNNTIKVRGEDSIEWYKKYLAKLPPRESIDPNKDRRFN